MGVVQDYLRGLIQKQVDDHRLVVWFDPDRYYERFAETLSLSETTVARYAGSFFALRREIEPLLGGETPPRLLVYVPLAEESTYDALAELTKAGVVLKPGQSPWQRNTRPSVVAKLALQGAWGEATAAAIAQEVEAGKITLEELDRLERPGRDPDGVLRTVFGASDPFQIALSWLGSDAHDAELVARNAVGEVAGLLGETFGLSLPPGESCEALRAHFARHVLATDFLASLRGPVPPPLTAVRGASDEHCRTACQRLAQAWRLRRDLRESYARFADRLETDLGLLGVAFDLGQLEECETFAATDRLLLAALSRWATGNARLAPEAYEGARRTVQRRLGGFWAAWPERYPDIQTGWQVLEAALKLLAAAATIEQELKSSSGGPEELVRRYAEGASADRPWCLLDTSHRQLERRWQDVDPVSTVARDPLHQLVALARQRYMTVGGGLAEQFTRALAAAGFRVQGVRRQAEVYASYVAPALREGKTAYLLVDALRYEMARELLPSLQGETEAEVTYALAAVPTVTEVGMAALLPKAESGAQVVPVSADRLGMAIEGTVLKDRKDRLKWLKANVTEASSGRQAKVFETGLEALTPPSRKVQAEVEEADLVVVTSQEIDGLGESDNVALARRVMEDVLWQIPRAIRALSSLGCRTIIFTSDHGYLFGEELSSDMKLDPPGGETIDLHRRVWVGRGGSASSAYLRAPLAAFGSPGDLELATPWGFGAFKVPGGAVAYFHGGLSLPELVIPVGIVKASAGAAPGPADGFAWQLVPGSRKVTTRFFSVQVTGQGERLFASNVPRVRVELRFGSQVISTPVAASYGFIEATGDVELRLKEGDGQAVEPNTVTLRLTQDPPGKAVSVHLLDAGTGRELARLESLDVAIGL